MYAIVKAGGKQYKVEKGVLLKVEKLHVKEGDTVELPAVFIRGDDGSLRTEGTVKATVLKHDKHKKILVFKYKRKKHYDKLNGHRQPYSLIKIEEIV
ncbi:MAG: 50S ribosomal protein L21 [Hydrogenothermaceae bacterium]|nr:50S ribosomal protein L21 [Hydrogenothermaceae bacterium]